MVPFTSRNDVPCEMYLPSIGEDVEMVDYNCFVNVEEAVSDAGSFLSLIVQYCSNLRCLVLRNHNLPTSRHHKHSLEALFMLSNHDVGAVNTNTHKIAHTRAQTIYRNRLLADEQHHYIDCSSRFPSKLVAIDAQKLPATATFLLGTYTQ